MLEPCGDARAVGGERDRHERRWCGQHRRPGEQRPDLLADGSAVLAPLVATRMVRAVRVDGIVAEPQSQERVLFGVAGRPVERGDVLHRVPRPAAAGMAALLAAHDVGRVAALLEVFLERSRLERAGAGARRARPDGAAAVGDTVRAVFAGRPTGRAACAVARLRRVDAKDRCADHGGLTGPARAWPRFSPGCLGRSCGGSDAGGVRDRDAGACAAQPVRLQETHDVRVVVAPAVHTVVVVRRRAAAVAAPRLGAGQHRRLPVIARRALGGAQLALISSPGAS